jgi:sialic acid synthase SpsE
VSATGRASVNINGRRVGQGFPCLIIAEIGSNHNGDLGTALRMIEMSAKAGADAVKFQLFRIDSLYPRAAGTIDAERIHTDIYQALQPLQVPPDWLPALAEAARKSGVLFTCSVFDELTADQADPFVAVFKIASYELTHYPLLRHVAGKSKPVILSTGGADLDEVSEAVAELRGAGCSDIVLMQCTAEYPAPVESLNLRALETMGDKFGVPTGLSDHSADPDLAPVLAVALGASVIEKHVTLSKKMPGPDHEFAMEPDEFAAMVARVRAAEQALGSGVKQHHAVEEKRRAFGRRTIFAVSDIAAGEAFTKDNVAVLRRGEFPIALHPREYFTLLGRRASKAIKGGEPVPADATVPPAKRTA